MVRWLKVCAIAILIISISASAHSQKNTSQHSKKAQLALSWLGGFVPNSEYAALTGGNCAEASEYNWIFLTGDSDFGGGSIDIESSGRGVGTEIFTFPKWKASPTPHYAVFPRQGGCANGSHRVRFRGNDRPLDHKGWMYFAAGLVGFVSDEGRVAIGIHKESWSEFSANAEFTGVFNSIGKQTTHTPVTAHAAGGNLEVYAADGNALGVITCDNSNYPTDGFCSGTFNPANSGKTGRAVCMVANGAEARIACRVENPAVKNGVISLVVSAIESTPPEPGFLEIRWPSTSARTVVGHPILLTVSLSNTGGQALTRFQGPSDQLDEMFEPFTHPYFGEGNNCGTSLEAGESCILEIVFDPTAEGSYSQPLLFRYSDGTNELQVSQYITAVATLPAP